jgi:hypothetical protein
MTTWQIKECAKIIGEGVLCGLGYLIVAGIAAYAFWSLCQQISS